MNRASRGYALPIFLGEGCRHLVFLLIRATYGLRLMDGLLREMWQVHDSRDVTAKAVSEILNKKELFIRKDPGSKVDHRCRVPDDQIAYRSYPLLAARELLQQFIREQVHEHQAA